MVSRRLLFFFGLAALVAACGGSGGGSPLAPTVTPPAGCSGTAIEKVLVSFTGSGSAVGINLQVFGKTFNQQIAAGQSLNVTEDVVPCSYEITGHMTSGQALSVGFGRNTTNGFSGPFNPQAGVERGSIVVDEGPNPVFGPTTQGCHVDFKSPTGFNAPLPPFSLKIRFKVSSTNAVNQGPQGSGGCS